MARLTRYLGTVCRALKGTLHGSAYWTTQLCATVEIEVTFEGESHMGQRSNS